MEVIGEVRRRRENNEIPRVKLKLETGWPEFLEHRGDVDVMNAPSPEGRICGERIEYKDLSPGGESLPRGDM